MTDQILKTSEQWQGDAELNHVVLDPDGWDRSNFDFSFYEEKITEQEFMRRLANSTLIISTKQKSFFN